MLRRIEYEDTRTDFGFFLADPFKRGNLVFEVLAIGPGRTLKHPFKNKSVFIKPEVAPGDKVISRHWFTASEHPSWHKPEHLDGVDGRGRVILDARFIECILPKPEIIPFVPMSHL
jgi:co-chaperonin GroES (HSP10)